MARVFIHGSLGLGESYMDGWWECGQLDEFFNRILRRELDGRVAPWADAVRNLRARLFNLQTPARAFRIGRYHYDIGNDLYRYMLGVRMIYSCALWKNSLTLEQAREDKLNLVCRKLGLRPGMRLLDVGCGWGGTVRYAAERFGVGVVGVTVSAKQAELGRRVCAGLDVDIRLQDYRDVKGEFDRIVSLGMFEHVGSKNYRSFMRVIRGHLKNDGLFLIQTIGGNTAAHTTDPWIERYVLPNSMLPSAGQIGASIEGAFVLEDWQSLGAEYDRTLMQWFANFHERWPDLKDRYDKRFYRIWKLHLLSAAGSFRARRNQVWQLVLSPHGVPGGYSRPLVRSAVP